MSQKILIIGSSGMLGVDLSQSLQHDHKVFGADMVHRACAIRGFYKLDITKKQNVSDVIKNLNPDIIIHTAAWTDVDGCELDPKRAYKINSEGVKNVAYACKAIGAVLIYISTDFVFDGRRKNPYEENDRTNPLSVYADSKLRGEKAIRRIVKKHFILRTSWLYGKHGKNFVDTIINKAKTEKVLKVVDDQIGSPTYTKDLAKAIHSILNKSTDYGTYHVSGSGSTSWCDYAKEILKLAGSRTKVLPISSKELDRPAKRPKMSVLDNSKFFKFTGYKMMDWREALKEYV